MELCWHFLILCLISLLSIGSEARVITLVNRCSTTVWPGFRVVLAHQASQFVEDGIQLNAGQSANITTPPFWGLYIWGRSGCSFDSSGKGPCITGDCGGLLRCALGGFPELPITMAVLSLNDQVDTYGVYLGAGFNIPMSIVPYGGANPDQCKPSSCNSDLNRICPIELQVKINGLVVACKSACLAFNRPEFCCLNTAGEDSTCKPTNYTAMFKEACPAASPDGSSQNTFTCTRAQYVVTFC